MILSVSSNLPTFKTLRFGRGLNVLVADMTGSSTEGQTRNSAGKSSLVEIIHFVLGAEVQSGSLFKAQEFAAHSFSLTMRINGVVARVTRRCATPQRVLIDERRARRLRVPFQRDDVSDEVFVSLDDWKEFLGRAWFKLPLDRASTDFQKKRAPTYRMLFGYFARRSRDVGFAHPERYGERFPERDAQVAVSYMLGLDWTIPLDIRNRKDRDAELVKLKQIVKAADLGRVFGSSAEIRPELVRAEERVVTLQKDIADFEVHGRYAELSSEAANLHGKAGQLTLALGKARNTLQYLRRVVDQEAPPAFASVELVYEAIGIELPGMVRRRFEDVQKFQLSVVQNRRNYLREQIEDAAVELEDLQRDLVDVRGRQAEIADELRGKGPLAQLITKEKDLAQAQARRDSLSEKLTTANVIENSAATRKKESAEDELRLQKDYQERADAIARAVSLVDHAIGALYDDREGNFIIRPTKNGPVVSVNIGGGGGQGGIDSMKIFCFDMMLYEVVSERIGGPRFLLHDSHLFDGVDKRQTRSALLYGRDVARRVGGQYLVTMNSDKLESLDDAAEIRAAVIHPRLTDTENGGLFGFRFDL